MALRIGRVALGQSPVICAVLQRMPSRSVLSKLKRDGIRLLELRIDHFPKMNPAALADSIRSIRRSGFSVMVTIRMKEEGGAARMSESKRLELYKALLPAADAADIELRSALCGRLIAAAHRRGKRCIVSCHEFKKKFSERDATNRIKKAKRLGADFVKIAWTVKNQAEARSFAALTFRLRHMSLIMIPMGERMKHARLFFPFIGSLLMYGFVGKSAAPGQLSAAAVARFFRRALPSGAKHCSVMQRQPHCGRSRARLG
jgi:3-dehydroquinate dehydratase-1